MNKIDQTLETLKSLDYKSPVRRRYINKLTAQDLILFDKKIKEGYFLPDIHLHREDTKCHNLGLTILDYLYNEEEIIDWFNGCLKCYFKDMDAKQAKIIQPFKVYTAVLGIQNLGADLGYDEKIGRDLFEKYFKNYRNKLPYPSELVNTYLKAIENRTPLTEAINKTREIFGKGSYNNFSWIIETDVLPVIGKDGLREYIQDMVVKFKKARKVNPDIPINQRDFSFFLTGNCQRFILKNVLKFKNISSDWIKAYLEALLPELIKVKFIKREKIYELLEFDEAAIQEWENIYYIESNKKYSQYSYNVLEITPDRINEEELLIVKNNIKIVVDQFKPGNQVPTCAEIFRQAEIMNIKLSEKKEIFKPVVRDLIRDALEELKEFYYQRRKETIDFSSDLWYCYYKLNERIQGAKIDFSLIKSPELKNELKTVYQQLILSNSRLDKFTFLVSHCAGMEESAGITSFKDITAPKLRTFYHHLIFAQGLKPNTIGHYNTYFIKAFDILIREMPNLDIINEAREIHFHNIETHIEKTKIMPDSVLKEINAHLDELPKNIELLFKLLMTTGWRFKEIVNLRPENFRKVEGYPDLIEVEITNTKTTSSRKNAGYTLHPCDFIPVSLYNQLQEYLKETRNEREFYHIDTCFYVLVNSIPCSITHTRFNNSINRLIRRHHITDTDGSLWHFSSKQTRKKVAITLIEEGVPLNVVQQKLTHQNPVTTQTYYTENDEIKLAQMNKEHFKKYVQDHLDPDVQERLSKTELKQLYLNYEESLKLENGVCRKPLCSDISEKSCAKCSKICTSELYLKEWEKLLESVRNVKARLERLYKQNGLNSENYTDFSEYQNLVQKERYLKGVVNEIRRKARK